MSAVDAEGGDGRIGGVGVGGDPLKEAFNRLGSVIDFQGKQQVTKKSEPLNWALVVWMKLVLKIGSRDAPRGKSRKDPRVPVS